MKELTISMDLSRVGDMIGTGTMVTMRGSISKGVRDSLAWLQGVHKRETVGRGIGPWGGVWSTRTGEALRSFHIDYTTGELAGAYGSELRRIGVLEMGTQEALGGPLRPTGGRKYLTIPTQNAKVGKGRAVAAKDRTDLVFIKSKSGTPMLVRPRAGKGGGFDVMFILRTQVIIPPHPTLERAQQRGQAGVDRIMLDALPFWNRSGN